MASILSVWVWFGGVYDEFPNRVVPGARRVQRCTMTAAAIALDREHAQEMLATKFAGEEVWWSRPTLARVTPSPRTQPGLLVEHIRDVEYHDRQKAQRRLRRRLTKHGCVLNPDADGTSGHADYWLERGGNG